MGRFLVVALLSSGALIAFRTIPAAPIYCPLALFSNSAQQATVNYNSGKSNSGAGRSVWLDA